jgi:hypothetical protein
MRSIRLLAALQIAVSAHAAPPPDVSGQYSDWFRSLTVPGSPNTPCCTVADCRMVESRWNDEAQHYEAKVIRDVFSNALRSSVLYKGNFASYEKAKYVWISKWMTRFGDKGEAWIEVPGSRVNLVPNPTGHSVLCWSTFYPDFNGCSASSRIKERDPANHSGNPARAMASSQSGSAMG